MFLSHSEIFVIIKMSVTLGGKRGLISYLNLKNDFQTLLTIFN